MENVIIKNPVATSEEIFAKNLCGEINEDIILPDYFPDISQILKSKCQCEIVSKSIKNGLLSLEVFFVARIFYCCEEKKLHCIEHKGSLTLSCDTSISQEDEKSCVILASCCNKFLNCKAQGPRRLLLKGEIGAEASVIRSKETETVCESSSEQLQLKTENETTSKLLESGIYQSDINTEVSLKNNAQNVGDIICFDSLAKTYECQCLGGKIIVKGDIFLNCLFASLNEDEEPIKADFSLPFNEIISCDDADDDCEVCVRASLCDMSLQPSSFSSDESADFSLNGRLILNYTVSKQTNSTHACDCYHTKNNCQAEMVDLSFLRFIQKINETVSVRENVKLPFDAEKIVYSLCEVSFKDYSFLDGCLKLRYILNCSLFLKKDGGGIVSYPFSKEDEIKISLGNQKGKVAFRGNICCDSFTTTLSGNNNAEIRCKLEVDGFAYSVFKETVISSLKKGDKKEKSLNGSCLKVYFASQGEKVWDIGKKYNTSVKAITEENGITSDEIPEKTMLIIPIL